MDAALPQPVALQQVEGQQQQQQQLEGAMLAKGVAST
jgi:hypothetical protein